MDASHINPSCTQQLPWSALVGHTHASCIQQGYARHRPRECHALNLDVVPWVHAEDLVYADRGPEGPPILTPPAALPAASERQLEQLPAATAAAAVGVKVEEAKA